MSQLKKCTCIARFYPIREAPENHAQITTPTWAGKLASCMIGFLYFDLVETSVHFGQAVGHCHRLKNQSTNGPTDRPTDLQTETDRPPYRPDRPTDWPTEWKEERKNQNQSVCTQTFKVDSQLNRQFSLWDALARNHGLPRFPSGAPKRGKWQLV